MPRAANTSFKNRVITIPSDCTIAGQLTSPVARDDARERSETRIVPALFAPSRLSVGQRGMYMVTPPAEPKGFGHFSFREMARIIPSQLRQRACFSGNCQGTGALIGFPEARAATNYLALEHRSSAHESSVSKMTGIFRHA